MAAVRALLHALIGGDRLMSTIPKAVAHDSDPYRYGWRYVRGVASDGTETFDQVPLTAEDLLFPQEDDFIVETNAHDDDRGYLKAVYKVRLAPEPTAVVLANCLVDFNLPRVKPLGPDVAVFLGVKRQRDWATFDVKAERARPLLVVEIVSQHTRKNDLGIKKKFYYQAGVPLYVIADLVLPSPHRQLKLIGNQRTLRGYHRMVPDGLGRIVLEPLGLKLGVTWHREGGYDRLACYDAVTGAEIGDYTAVNEARRSAEERAESAEQRAESAEQRAESVEQRAESAEQRAQAEAKARAELEARVKALEAEVRRSGRRKP
jgi:hypothetical protein